ncbi:MAG: 4a-hydroxytetrahydrobiopterin dehydratase [SAR324 cluster bacterium]|nr:4a-hydroxytetrahydrobiopterin dehydratase [SAR324 cluster bacterium]
MGGLSQKQCVPCQGGVLPLQGTELQQLLGQLDSQWQLVEEHHLEKEYRFPDFKSALDFTNKIGALAESEGHHPDIHLAWGRVKLVYWTHKIEGLTESDFIMAAKSDMCFT